MTIDHQSPRLVIFGQHVMGRRPLHPTGYLPVWPWVPHGPLGQVESEVIGLQSPGSVNWNFFSWVDAHYIPRVTAPCGRRFRLVPTAKQICGLIANSLVDR